MTNATKDQLIEIGKCAERICQVVEMLLKNDTERGIEEEIHVGERNGRIAEENQIRADAHDGIERILDERFVDSIPE